MVKNNKIGLYIIPLLIKRECRHHSFEQFENNKEEGVVDAIFVRFLIYCLIIEIFIFIY